ncbi:MAG: nucleotidyltransferase domain-containing protein [Draconibacterium sp.]|nr:nucleotidyltransferase domain-containing protein [Draconibacterium sp.]
MRLSKYETDTIKKIASEIWGDNVVVYLFGSRTDDSIKGGDIDLYIQLTAEQDPKSLVLQKARFLGKLDFLLGEQKIDLVVKTRYNKKLSIVHTAESTGIML